MGELTAALNKYVDSQAPWKLHKEGQFERLESLMNILLAALRNLAICLWPIMPDTSSEMLDHLGLESMTQKAKSGESPLENLEIEINEFLALIPGLSLAKSSALFPRIPPPSDKNDECETKPETKTNENL